MSYLVDENSVFGVGFLERLDINAKPISLSQGPDSIDVLNSIKLNVANVLNTRLGEAQSAPNLGLIDFNDASLGVMDLSLRVKMAVQRCLNTYEPRLCNLQINTVTDPSNPLSLCFHINADINSAALHDKVEINLILGNDRKYRVY
jgi:type VI secretion system protein